MSDNWSAYAAGLKDHPREGSRFGLKTCMNCGEPRRDVVDGWCASCESPERPVTGHVGVLDTPPLTREQVQAWALELRSYEDEPPCPPAEAAAILRQIRGR